MLYDFDDFESDYVGSKPAQGNTRVSQESLPLPCTLPGFEPMPYSFEPPDPGRSVHITVGVDWLRGSVSSYVFPKVLKFIASLFPGVELADTRHRIYKIIYTGPFGLKLATDTHDPQKLGDHAMVSLPGSALASLHPHQRKRLFSELAAWQFSCSRLDAAFDDFTKALAILSDLTKDDVKADVLGFRKVVKVDGNRPDEFTFYFGTRGRSGGGKFCRIYNKSIESEGHIDSIRCEVEFTRHYAQQAFQMLADADLDFWPQLIWGLVNGAINFRTNEAWAAIQTLVEGCPVRLEPKKPNLKNFNRAVDWLKKQVAPTLAAVFDIFCFLESHRAGRPVNHRDWIEFCISLWIDGESRWNDSHINMINEIKFAYSTE